MSVQAKKLFDAKFAENIDALQFVASVRTIIDKFTACNTDASSSTLTIYIVPKGQAVSAKYKIIEAHSINASSTKDFTEVQNQILGPGDMIYTKAGAADKVVIRASGREIT